MKHTKENQSAFLMKLFNLLFIFLFAFYQLNAQGIKQAKPKASPVPDPIQRMEKLMGKWEGNIHSETGPVVTKKELKATFDFTSMLKNLGVKVSTKFEVVDTPKVTEGAIFMGYDATDNELHALMMNDKGEAFDLIGKWTNDYNLNFSCNTSRGGKHIGITLWMNIKVPDQLGYKMYTTIGDDLLITDEGALMKKKTEAPKPGSNIPPKK